MTFENSNQAKLAAHRSWAVTRDRAARTAAARAAKEARLVASVDPDGEMSDCDRAKAIAHARRAWALSLVEARKAKRAALAAREAALATAAAAEAARRQADQDGAIVRAGELK